MEDPQTDQVETFQTDSNELKETQEEDIPPEFLIKHPLQNAWTLWYFENLRSGDWKQNQKSIISFDTIEDFWSIYNYTKLASELKTGSDYSLFKNGISPMWEDPVNAKGGRWIISLEKKQKIADLDKLWLEVCLCLIGEAFQNADDVCGAIVAVRQKQFRISVWTTNIAHTDAILEIGHKLKDRLKLSRQKLDYEKHEDSQHKSGSTVKKMFSI